MVQWLRFCTFHSSILGCPCDSTGKQSACNPGDVLRSLGWKDPLEKGKVTYFSRPGKFYGLYSPRGPKELVGATFTFFLLQLKGSGLGVSQPGGLGEDRERWAHKKVMHICIYVHICISTYTNPCI